MKHFDKVRDAMVEYKRVSGTENKDMIVVMGPRLIEALMENVRKLHGRSGERPKKMLGAEIVVREKIKGEEFGILHKECLDHIDDHLDEILKTVEKEIPKPVEVEFYPCDLCKCPLSTVLADGCDIVCPWCGDVNDLDDMREKK